MGKYNKLIYDDARDRYYEYSYRQLYTYTVIVYVTQFSFLNKHATLRGDTHIHFCPENQAG